MYKKQILIFIILCFGLIGCIEYKEKMKLNSDSSGTITFSIGMNEDILTMGNKNAEIDDFNEEELKKAFKGKEGISLIDSRTYTKDGNRWIEITLDFDSVEKLEKASRDSSGHGIIGDISLVKNENGKWVYTRKILGRGSELSNETDTTSNGMMAMMFSQYKWRYELVLPSKIISTDADKTDIDNNTNTIKWTYSLASLTSGRTMTATFENKNYTNVFYIIGGGIILLLLSISAFMLNRKKKI